MNVTKLLTSTLFALLGSFSLAANAATLDLTNLAAFPTGGKPGNTGTIQIVNNINDYAPGASSGFYITGAVPNSITSSQLQGIFKVANIDFTITDFNNLDPAPAGNFLDTSSLGLAFQGFLMKVGNFNLVALFDSPVSQLAFSNLGLLGISHVAYFNTSAISEVPVPAALFLFGPALLGFLGLRRRFNK